MRRQRRARFGARAGHDVQDACGQAAIGGDMGEGESGQRGLFGGLQHHGVADAQGRHDGAADDLHRIVPRDDVARHPVRLAQGVDGVAVLERNGLAVQLVRRACVEFQIAGQGDHVVAGLLQRLADVQRLKLGQQVDAGFDLAHHAGQDAAAFDGGGAAPASVEGGTRGADGVVHVGGGSGGQPAHDLARRRVLDRQGRVGGACGAPDAVDEELIRGEGRDHVVRLTMRAIPLWFAVQDSGHDNGSGAKPFMVLA